MRPLKERRELLLELANRAKEIDGRKKFQKIVYILQQLGAPFEEKFTYHYYGPYSPTLQLEIDDLVTSGKLEESKSNPYAYTYKPTQKNETSFLERYNNIINFLANKPSYLLELVSTIFYLKEHYTSDRMFLRSKLAILKPRLKRYFDDAFDLFEKLQQSSKS